LTQTNAYSQLSTAETVIQIQTQTLHLKLI